jgi:2-oxoglutarate ferredoxin oxidoreductase subunit beta
MSYAYTDYLNMKALPNMWCPGCGNGIIVRSVAESLAQMGLSPHKVVITTGIGCFGKADDYFATHTFHGSHGRALAFATGIKAGNPELHVIALMGDGDAVTIGGNHFIHTARRNMNITAIIANNLNYGMTGGQYSATSPLGSLTSTAPKGVPEQAFDVTALAGTAGANYAARTTAYHVLQLKKFIVAALQKPGFSAVEVMTPCPTHFGRRNTKGQQAMMRYFKDRVLSQSRYDQIPPEKREGYMVRGIFVDRDKPDFLTHYQRINAIHPEQEKGGRGNE